MKRVKKLILFFVFLLCISQVVFAVDNGGKCPKDGGESPYQTGIKVSKGSQLSQLYFGDVFSEGLDFQKDSIDVSIFAVVNNKNFDLDNLIPEFKDFGNKGQIDISNGFKYNMSPEQLKLLNGINNELEIIARYRARINEKAFEYLPERDDCILHYGNNQNHGSTPKFVKDKTNKKITVLWDDDNDRDGLRTKQEVYYLKLDNTNDNENGPLFIVLEIPSRGKNQEEQYFSNVPKTWEAYKLDGRELENYVRIISEDGSKITYKHDPARVNFNVNVVWKDEEDKFETRPEQLNFTISPQEMGNEYSVKASNKWSKSFKEYEFEEGKELNYSLEFPDIDKYDKSVEKDGNNYTVTYTSKIIEAEEIQTNAKINVVATKTWVDGKEEDHKEVKLELYRKANSSEEELLNIAPEVKEEGSKFIYNWKGMPATNTKGEIYKYSVKEVEVPDNYEVTYDGLNVTNTYKSPTRDVEVKVKWVGGDPQDSKIILYRKNLNSELEKVGEFDSNKNNLSIIFKNLSVTDRNGENYTYYAYEPEVPEGFTVSYSDDELTVINTKISDDKPVVKPEPKPESKPDPKPAPKPDPKPDPQVVEEIEGPVFKRHDYTPTYPVITRVPEKDSLKYIFTVDDYYYEEVKNGLTRDFKMDVAPLIKNERTMLPLRYVGEALDAEVKWDEDTRTAIFIKNGLRAEIQIDKDEIIMSKGETIKMDSKPLNINSRILVPVTNVANVFGLTNGNTEDNIKQDIEWDRDTRTVTIYVR